MHERTTEQRGPDREHSRVNVRSSEEAQCGQLFVKGLHLGRGICLAAQDVCWCHMGAILFLIGSRVKRYATTCTVHPL